MPKGSLIPLRLFLSFGFALLVGCSVTSVETESSHERPFEIQGRIDGFFGETIWGIRTDNGQAYGISNLPKELQRFGLYIKAKAKLIETSTSSSSDTVSVELSEVRPVSELVEAWDRLFDSALRDDPIPLVRLEEFRRRYGFPLAFWPSENVEAEEVVEFVWSGCGNLYRSFVKQMPHGGNGLGPDLVFEFDASGKIFKRWQIPGNHVIDGIQGNELLVSYVASPIIKGPLDGDVYVPLYLAIAPDGEYRLIPPGKMNSDRRLIDCPEIKEFQDSAFKQCSVFEDLISREMRRLAYEGPCT